MGLCGFLPDDKMGQEEIDPEDFEEEIEEKINEKLDDDKYRSVYRKADQNSKSG